MKPKIDFDYCDGDPKATHPNEKEDCTVRAFTIASGKPYADVHRAFALHGRMDQRGCMMRKLCREVADRLGVRVRTVAKSGTVGEFVAANPQGNFVLMVAGHAFAVVNGQVRDTWRQTPGKKLKHAWKFL